MDSKQIAIAVVILLIIGVGLYLLSTSTCGDGEILNKETGECESVFDIADTGDTELPPELSSEG